MSTVVKTGGPAFPTQTALPGMDLRDWFAGQALIAVINPLMKAGYEAGTSPDDQALVFASGAYMIADAMIAERAKGQSK